jgi:hypothetical protein
LPTGRRRIGSGPIEPVDAERTLEVTQGLAVWTVGWGLQARGVAPLGLARRGERAATRVQGPAMNRVGLHRTAGCIEGAASNRVCIEQGSLRGGLNGTRNALAVDDPAGDARLGDVRHATSDRRRPAKRRSTGRPFAGRRSVGRRSVGRRSVGRRSAGRRSAGRRSAGRRSVWPREMDGLERAASVEPPPAPRPRPPSTLLDARLRHRVAAERSLLGAFTGPLRGAHDRRQAFGVGR